MIKHLFLFFLEFLELWKIWRLVSSNINTDNWRIADNSHPFIHHFLFPSIHLFTHPSIHTIPYHADFKNLLIQYQYRQLKDSRHQSSTHSSIRVKYYIGVRYLAWQKRRHFYTVPIHPLYYPFIHIPFDVHSFTYPILFIHPHAL